ncbi:hypothetical protein FH972_023008 [Carpinus fangiana]|uniref:Tetratricopeptide SHNi-TPR domain-containing protein n=1 Tax=Carpinus fangiana TaxID=176857 RepID=A0A5N6KTX7_9ROSI|nr:hypothetical protein FH972_023008 [Carpinus fangiana]
MPLQGWRLAERCAWQQSCWRRLGWKEEEARIEGGATIRRDDWQDLREGAYEILDVARVLLNKKIDLIRNEGKGKGKGNDKSPELKQALEKLADIHDLQAEISLENENFPMAVADTQAALNILEDLFPLHNRLVAEAHFKLSLALEFASITQVKAAEGQQQEEAQVDEGMRAEAAEHTAKTIESCKLRKELEVETLKTLAGEEAEEKKKQIKDVTEMLEEFEQRALLQTRGRLSSVRRRRRRLKTSRASLNTRRSLLRQQRLPQTRMVSGQRRTHQPGRRRRRSRLRPATHDSLPILHREAGARLRRNDDVGAFIMRFRNSRYDDGSRALIRRHSYQPPSMSQVYTEQRRIRNRPEKAPFLRAGALTTAGLCCETSGHRESSTRSRNHDTGPNRSIARAVFEGACYVAHQKKSCYSYHVTCHMLEDRGACSHSEAHRSQTFADHAMALAAALQYHETAR